MKTRVYDVPTRLFHGMFAGSFLTAFVIANTVDDESLSFAYHMLAGLFMLFVVAWRLIWGLVGTRHARFSDFQFSPAGLAQYLAGIVSGSKAKWAGHNPASSWAALLMLGMAIGLGVTGIAMASGAGEAYEDLHELLANGLLFVVVLHVAGVVLHQLKHRDAMALSMLTGDKHDVDHTEPVVRSHTLLGGALLLASFWFGTTLWQHFDRTTGQLQLFGVSLQLTDNEGAEHGERDHGERDDD